jgi:hypothetical protein
MCVHTLYVICTYVFVYTYIDMYVCVCVCEGEYYYTYDKSECMRSQNTALTVTVLETGRTSRQHS